MLGSILCVQAIQTKYLSGYFEGLASIGSGWKCLSIRAFEDAMQILSLYSQNALGPKSMAYFGH